MTHNLVDFQWHWNILSHQRRVWYDSVLPAEGQRILPWGTPDGTGERLEWNRGPSTAVRVHLDSSRTTAEVSRWLRTGRVSEAAFGGRHCRKPLRDPNTQCPTAGSYLETGRSRDKTPAAEWQLIDPEGNHAVYCETKDRETPRNAWKCIVLILWINAQ